ncbi:unnamed protein product [Adineta steineri]|uniref:FZ domain-containing protein n=1 Tax=Adineta steineri TaxID=433720 RepID=A0A814I9V1_9BILA|nr:unnamed protein product [Adineta steineri]
MMQNKVYLLFTLLCVFIICLASADETPRQADSALDLKKSVSTKDKKESRDRKNKHDKNDAREDDKYDIRENDKYEHEDEDDEVDDSYISRSSFDHERYSPYGSREGNYRTRSRHPVSSPQAPPPQSLTQSLSQLIPSLFEAPMDENDWTPNGYENMFAAPVPYNAPDINVMSNNGPTCHSLIDAHYPIFSDVCGAVPQAKYSLPNAFGHREKWQISQILTALMSSPTEATCTRSLRLLLCPILFPPCSTRHQPAPVLPCQSYCRAVKSRCSIPVLDTLPCEVLPYSSDLCPSSQPFASFGLPGAFPSSNQPSPVNGGFPTARTSPSLQSLLSSPAFQALLAAHGFQSGAGTQNLQGGFPAQTAQPAPPQQNFQSAYAAQNYPTPFTPQNFPSAFGSQNLQSAYAAQNYPTAFTPQNFPSTFGSQNLQSPFSAQNLQSTLTPQNLQAALSAQAAQSVTTPAPVLATPAPAPATPAPTPAPASFNPYMFGAPATATDSFNSMPADYQSRLYSNEYRPSPRYAPYPRSSSETRPTNELRASTETRTPTDQRSSMNTRPTSGSSMVKA